mmetsp:Transcript_69058/g.195759  ORF Transcript_69058/g.195759 Transcript_69058/m.195759 type:complete len:274 (+) Transcript_69058:188-1009(+)
MLWPSRSRATRGHRPSGSTPSMPQSACVHASALRVTAERAIKEGLARRTDRGWLSDWGPMHPPQRCPRVLPMPRPASKAPNKTHRGSDCRGQAAPPARRQHAGRRASSWPWRREQLQARPGDVVIAAEVPAPLPHPPPGAPGARSSSRPCTSWDPLVFGPLARDFPVTVAPEAAIHRAVPAEAARSRGPALQGQHDMWVQRGSSELLVPPPHQHPVGRRSRDVHAAWNRCRGRRTYRRAGNALLGFCHHVLGCWLGNFLGVGFRFSHRPGRSI